MFKIATKLIAKVACSGKNGPLLSILIYHRVLPSIDEYAMGTVDEHQFDIQMRSLTEHFNVIPLGEAVDRLRSNSLPPRAACVTFDDGYADNSEIALKILTKYEIRATFFIATGYLDGGIMWNDVIIETIKKCKLSVLDLKEVGLERVDLSGISQRIEAISLLISSLKYMQPKTRESVVRNIAEMAEVELPTNLMMTTAQVKKLFDNGMLIGGHTVSHPILSKELDSHVEQEIRDGKLCLEDIIREPVDMFAYPNGKPGVDYENKHIKMVKAAGFKLAVSTVWGVSNSQSDVFQLARFTPWDNSPNKFIARLLHNSYSRRSPNILIDGH